MSTWVKLIIGIIHFFPMLLFSLLLFRIRIKPYWTPISLTVLVGTLCALFTNSPLPLVCLICMLLMCVWRYRFIPALFIALSGYMVAVLVSTTTIVIMDLAHAKAYIDVKDDFTISMVARFFILLAKCGLIFILYKKRFGFTFLTHYTKIPLVRENAGEYLYMIVLIVGMIYRHAFRDSVFSAVMPIQMLSMAVFLFIYVMLSKELSLQR